ncbi:MULTISPECIES: Arc family DNA-binding protein [Pseudomonas]|uniref:Arc family DNA-binding protein n=1 Tax=Pseudomonas helleri TaxID=1608996 RepID=A0A6I1WVJ8_9PSED|nr:MULTISPECIES: Arc family DNA-binding protein [Pseudomonas]MQT56890.1 Arc family DNA-binding protein [Pseudomonas sp. FSL R10-0399]MQU46258.1 Arc family DNA-binding protein [Pseudomonas helleri]
MRDSREQDKFVLRLPEGLRPEIANIARTNQRSMNGEIIVRIQRSVILDKLHIEQDKIIAQLLKRIESLEQQVSTKQ